ncbi:MAG: hypothetical protein Q9193_003030 [Seirophora villosa]
MPANINSDVGGIGTGLAVLGFLGTIFWKWTVPNIYVGFMAQRHGWAEAREKSRPVYRIAQKHLSRLIVALTDFHKAQCFFVLATNIAALVVTRIGGLDPQSLQQIYNTWIFLKVVAINSFFLVNFTMWNLYLVGMHSWYTSLMSSLATVSSIVTYTTLGQFNPSQFEMKYLASIAASGGPSECDFKQPGVYCYSPPEFSLQFDADSNNKLIWYVLVTVFLLGHVSSVQDLALVKSWRRRGSIALLVLIHGFGILIQRLCRHPVTMLVYSRISEAAWTCMEQLSRPVALVSEMSGLPRMRTWLAGRVHPIRTSRLWQLSAHVRTSTFSSLRKRLRALTWKRLIRGSFNIGVFLLFLMIYIPLCIDFLYGLAWFGRNKCYNMTWNFGQVVALTVWAQPICEYIYLELRGLRRGFDHKLLPPYRVSRDDDVVHNHAVSHRPAASEKSHSTGDLERGEEMPQIACPAQGAPSMYVGEDDVELASLPADDGSDAFETEEELHNSAIQAPTTGIPLEDKERMDEDQQWLLLGPDSLGRTSTFPRTQHERPFSW